MRKVFLKEVKGASAFEVILVLIVLFLVFNAAFRYYGVVYDCANLKNEMRAAVFLGQATSASGTVAIEQAKQRIHRAMNENGAPSNAYMDVWTEDGQMYSRVAFTAVIPILPFDLYRQEYVFDETVGPQGFLPKISPTP